MTETLEDLLRRLRKDMELLEAGEEAICLGVVLPVLARLGWDWENIRQVVPQYAVGNGKVDYCLRARDRKVFIEVKRARESLDAHQKQLLDYSFQEGVEIAVLTSGLVWWLYLPLLKGSWEERRFLAVDIRQQEVPDAARHLAQFLTREAVADGSAVEQAEALHESKEVERLVQQTIPRAWEELCKGPDQSLVELLSDKVESLCGHRPDVRAIAAFFAVLVPPQTSLSPPPPPPGPNRGPGTARAAGICAADCRAAILRALHEQGGPARADDVLDRCEQLLRPKLTPYQRETLPSGGEVRWRKTVQWQRFTLTQQGLIRKGSPRGLWELTDRGMAEARRLPSSG